MNGLYGKGPFHKGEEKLWQEKQMDGIHCNYFQIKYMDGWYSLQLLADYCKTNRTRRNKILSRANARQEKKNTMRLLLSYHSNIKVVISSEEVNQCDCIPYQSLGQPMTACGINDREEIKYNHCSSSCSREFLQSCCDLVNPVSACGIYKSLICKWIFHN